MSEQTDPSDKIRVRFSHLGLVVSDIKMMEDFYTRVVGFEKTDSGTASQGVTMTFMTTLSAPCFSELIPQVEYGMSSSACGLLSLMWHILSGGNSGWLFSSYCLTNRPASVCLTISLQMPLV